MATGTAAKPSAAELKQQKKDREERERQAEKSNGRADIDAAHAALGTSIEGGIDPGPQDVHDGDDDEAQSASGAPVQLSFAVGGKRPTTSGLRLMGGKLDVEQVFSKGEKIVLLVEAEIRAVEFVDQVDGATGQVIGSERRHKASIVGVSVQ